MYAALGEGKFPAAHIYIFRKIFDTQTHSGTGADINKATNAHE